MIRNLFKISSLRRKLIASTVIVEIIMLSILIWNSIRIMEDNLYAQLENRITELQPLLNASLAGSLFQDDLATIDEIINQFKTDDIVYIAVYDTSNNVILKKGTSQLIRKSNKAIKTWTKQELQENYIYPVTMSITLGQQVVGRIELEMDASFIYKTTNTINQQGLIIAAVEIILSIFLLGGLGFVFTRHIQELTDASKTMAAGDFSIRIPIHNQDEISQAAKNFNHMAAYIAQNQHDIKESENHIRQLNTQLEQRVADRTHELRQSNKRLQNSLTELEETQTQLIQSEKMAALGQLVAGVAHEINTPIGIGVTAVSHLQLKIEEYTQFYQDDTLSRNDFESLLDISQKSTNMILTNLQRAAQLIQSFKQVAVDQSSDKQRQFNLKQYLHEILQSLHPKLKTTYHHIELICPEDVIIRSYPGAYSQIITNLVMNSLIHGFEKIDTGIITLTITHDEQAIKIIYQDNGQGIAQEHIKKIFEPFFTTKRNLGGSGLGMQIVYNLVTQKLHGQINCSSELGQGATFTILLPIYFDNTIAQPSL